MTTRQFVRAWYMGLAIAGGVVLAVATLLLAIIATARSILGNARRALELANEIVANTHPIWQLEQTNAVAGQLLEGAAAIERDAADVAGALEAPQPTP